MFRRYDHIERLGHEYVDALTIGDVYVFPKLDGTNASVWFEDGGEVGWFVQCGSRTRTLTADKDNAGFHRWAHDCINLANLYEVFQNGSNDWNIYGEWLVPHTLTTYREEAWRKFWVFDVYDNKEEKYLSYDVYSPIIKNAGLDVIEPLCIFSNPSDEQLQHEAEMNTYLILDGGGAGEGIVIKNYLWRNKWDNQPWAKIVRNEFKEENKRAFGTTEKHGKFQVEAAIAEEFVTQALVEKTRAKIMLELTEQDCVDKVEDRYGDSPDYYDKCMERHKRVQERHRAKIIPQLLGRVYHDLVTEELWEALKKHKFPVVDFNKLRGHSIVYTKKYAADLF